MYSVFARKVFVPPADLLTGLKVDLALYGHFVRSPLMFGGKSITVIYDLSYIHFQQFSNMKTTRFYTKEVPRTIKRSDHIVTISENAKNEIVDYYKIDPAMITIISPAVNADLYKPRSKSEIFKIKKQFNIRGKYILFTGTLEPRKNIVTILNSYEKLPKKITDEFSLVLAGGKGWLDGSIKERLCELKDMNIITTGYVADEDLPALYSGASLFVYPSHYEGFGMPPLEAMACGVPVITSNNSSLPEVVGGAGILIDADDVKALTIQTTRVLEDSKMSAQMRSAGLQRAKLFSWEKSAMKLHHLIEKVTNS
jgi:glycosyltransferase involved in cell wall biosynthesis